MPAVRLDYWDTPIQVNGISFQPVTGSNNPLIAAISCDTPDRSLVFDVFVKPANVFLLNAADGFSGRLAIGSDGNILPKSAGVAGTDSRLRGPTSLSIRGLAGENFKYEPVADAYFNTYKSSYATSPNGADVGWLNLAGTLDVALFEDVKAHLQVRPAAALSPVYIMGGWPATGFESSSTAAYWQENGHDFFNFETFDADHEGKPVHLTTTTYRDQTTEDYNARAQKLWAQIVKFDYPLVWSSAAREFNGLEPKVKNLLVIETMSRLDHLTGKSADLAFGAQFTGAPIVNLTEMLLEDSGLNDALQDAVGTQLGFLDKGLGRLGDILDSDPHKFWDPILDAALDPVMDRLYNELEAKYQTVSPCNFAQEARPILDRYIKGAQGEANSVSNKLTKIAGVYTDAASVLGTTYTQLGEVHDALQSVIGHVGEDANADLIGDYAGMFAEEVVDQTAGRKARTKTQEMAVDLLGKLAGLAVDTAVAQLVDDLVNDSDLPLDEITATLQDLDATVLDIRERLKPGRDYALYMSGIINGLAAEVVSLTTLATEDAADYLESFVCGVDDPFLDVAEDVFKHQLTQFVKDRFYETTIPGAVQGYLKELLYDVNSLFVDATNAAISELNRILEKVLTEETIQGVEDAVGFVGDLGRALGAGKIKGDAHVVGDSLQQLTLDMDLHMGLGEDWNSTDESSVLRLGAQLTITNYDNDGDDGTCSYGSVPATEVRLAVAAQAVDFLTDNFQLEAWVLFAFTTDTSPGAFPPLKVLQAGGGFEVPVIVPILPPLLQLTEIGGAASFGLKENYLSANCTVNVLGAADITGGLFMGKTCGYEAFGDWAPDVKNLIVMGPDGWSGIYSESLANMGIGNSCMLEAQLGGGIGYGFDWKRLQVLGRIHGHVDGSLLCFLHAGAQAELDVRGDLNDLLGGDIFGSIWFKGCATVELQVIFTISQTICITYQDGEFTGE